MAQCIRGGCYHTEEAAHLGYPALNKCSDRLYFDLIPLTPRPMHVQLECMGSHSNLVVFVQQEHILMHSELVMVQLTVQLALLGTLERPLEPPLRSQHAHCVRLGTIPAMHQG